MREDRNCQWRVARRPDGNVVAADFQYTEEDIPFPGDGEFLLKTYYINLAPVMRMYMGGEAIAGEVPLAIGDVIHGRAVAEIIESRHPDYQVGDFVHGQCGWQTYKVSKGTKQEKFRKLPDLDISYSAALGALGMTGFSAYFGFVDCGRPQAGDIVVVSGAAGGVGSQVIQIARLKGCHVIGIAGGPGKCELIRSLGCDETIDYKTGNIAEKLAAACPDGIDLYFDNVGGETLTAVLENLRMHSRIVLCGSISEYLLDKPFGLSNYTRLRRTNTTMQGFFVYNHVDDFDRAEHDMSKWLQSGQLRPVEHIFDGFAALPDALASLYTGTNHGIALVRIRRGPNDNEE
ncbi:MAG: NADP-dependent oxidoreductase [Gammaproteobacteria bacterium]|nr:NADP-dependent oxidoreductase [Gammaproteobacteria bacterium]